MRSLRSTCSTSSTHASADADEAELQRLGDLLLATLKTFKVEGTLGGDHLGPER